MATAGPGAGHHHHNNSHPNSKAHENLTFYPAFCFPNSPTHFTWVKLTAYDIHHVLTPSPSYHHSFAVRGLKNSQHSLYFYLNHPVQFVYVVGVVVGYEEWYEKRWVMSVDDGSGEVIEVICAKPQPMQQLGQNGERAAGSEVPKDERGRLVEEQERAEIMKAIDVGCVVKVKGRIGLFRDMRQIQLERVQVVQDTNVEVRFWDERMRLKREVLERPWCVSEEEQSRLRALAEGREEDGRKKERKRMGWEKKRVEREERHRRRILRRWEEEERKRKKAAEVARLAGEQLIVKRLGEGVNGAVVPRRT